MGNDSTYPRDIIVKTWRRTDDVAWGIYDDTGKRYTVKEAEAIWFAAEADEVYIDHNLTFARLVERNFDEATFDAYIQNR